MSKSVLTKQSYFLAYALFMATHPEGSQLPFTDENLKDIFDQNPEQVENLKENNMIVEDTTNALGFKLTAFGQARCHQATSPPNFQEIVKKGGTATALSMLFTAYKYLSEVNDFKAEGTVAEGLGSLKDWASELLE